MARSCLLVSYTPLADPSNETREVLLAPCFRIPRLVDVWRVALAKIDS
jgi:hypothetical protein